MLSVLYSLCHLILRRLSEASIINPTEFRRLAHTTSLVSGRPRIQTQTVWVLGGCLTSVTIASLHIPPRVLEQKSFMNTIFMAVYYYTVSHLATTNNSAQHPHYTHFQILPLDGFPEIESLGQRAWMFRDSWYIGQAAFWKGYTNLHFHPSEASRP